MFEFKPKPLASAIRLASIASVFAAAGGAPLAMAADEGATIEEVVVTGSRIKRKDFVSNSPVSTLAGSQFAITNTVNVEALLNALPQMVPGLDRTSNNPGNGTATVNLRGLGSGRSLVLINGKRVIPTTAGGTVDVNSIPVNLIENVEVLTGGASAIYGSDAVAGVVNFILKDDFSGVAFSSGYETTEKGDADIFSSDLTIGGNFDDGRGNMVINFHYTDREDLFQGDRDFAFFAQFDDVDENGNPILIDGGSTGIPSMAIFSGRFADRTIAGFDANGDPNFVPGFSPDTAGITFEPDGSIRQFRTGPVNDFYNYAPVNYIQLPQERYQITSMGHYDITDTVEVFGMAMFTSSKVPQQLAPTPIFQVSGFTIDGNPFLSGLSQSVLSGNNTDQLGLGTRQARVFSDGGTAFTATNTCTNCVFDNSFDDAGLDADGPANGIDLDPRFDIAPLVDADGNGIAETGGGALLRRRLLEVGPRVSDDEFTSWQLQIGLRGSMNNWDWEVYGQTGDVRFSNTQEGNVNRDRFDQALLLDLVADPTGGTCMDTSSSGSVVGCAPINIFGRGNISAAGADFLRVAVQAHAIYEQTILGASITGDTGEWFEMPGGAGPIGVAAGWESIDNDFEFKPSQDLASGQIAGFNGSPPVAGDFDVTGWFGEVYIPLVADRPGIELLDLELAIRASDYSTAGNVVSYKVAGSYSPMPGLRFRSSFNTAIRAPSIGELFSPQGENFPGSTDPCAAEGSPSAAVAPICISTGVPASEVGSVAINLPAGQVRELSGGNPDLLEEEAETFSVGIVYSPNFIEGLEFSIDYFDIDIQEAIANFGGGANNVLSICYDPADPAGGIGSEFCNVVNRRADGTIEFVSVTTQNVAGITLKGYDLIADYTTDLFGGSLNVHYVGTYTTEADLEPFEGATLIVCAGNFGNDCGEPQAKYKHRMTANWINDKWEAQVSWRMIGEVDDDDDGFRYFVETIDDTHYFDVVGAYRINEHIKVTLGIDNVLDEDPPILGDNQEQANTWPATYDVFGRTYFARLLITFEN